MKEDFITEQILNCAFKVHTNLGPGLLESSYKECLCYELSKLGLSFVKEKSLPLIYEDVKLDCGYRIDILVEDAVVVEIKSVEEFHDIHMAQVLTYLKLSGCRIGLLLNFNVIKLKYGIKRVIHGY